ncbi:Uncharacterised protein [Granulicatella adiacens]|uniref:DUF421 domain-containing protein n=1 Tax=Granulicatella adiacens TaxID=46124 RepID=UPI001957D0A7|nr:DUF421 domain-containing protein [Granulicatella adiacens]VTX78377.1 Uncharacterised protein [Granulicatella adiacens]
MNFSYIDVAIKLALGLLSLIVVINYTGKGNLAPTSASDQVQNYVLGGIIGGVIYNPSITILQYCIILLIWFALVLSLRWMKTNNSKVKKMIDGEPLQLIKRGKMDVENVRLAGLSAQEVAFKLRAQGVYSIRDVKSAILEQNGQLILTKTGEENPKYPLITDGVIQHNILEVIDKTEEWVTEQLAAQGIQDPSEVFLAEYNNGQLTVVKY